MIRLAAVLLGGALLAQEPTVRIRLAADPYRRGPAAWTWLRERVLPAAAGGLRREETLAALELRLSRRGLRVLRGRSPSGGYLTATLRAGAGLLATVRCRFDGLERWRIPRPAQGRVPPALRTLLSRVGLDRDRGPIAFDVAALVGNLAGPIDPRGDAADTALAIGPIECGELLVAVRPGVGDWRVVGRSEGGLLLPALLALLADLRARPRSGWRGAPRATDHERWRLWALAARGPARLEAARQLALCGTPAAHRTLERLLFDDATRVAAMDALIHAGASRALPALVAAATPGDPDTEAMAVRALDKWLPQLDARRRAAWLRALFDHPSARLRGFAAEHRRRLAASVPARRAAAPPGPPRREPWILALTFSAAVLGLAWLRARADLRLSRSPG